MNRTVKIDRRNMNENEWSQFLKGIESGLSIKTLIAISRGQ